MEARAGQRTRTGDRLYLLSGLLQTADGRLFSGETNKGQSAYRAKGDGRISSRIIEGAVFDQLFADLTAPDTAAMIAKAMRAQTAPAGKPRDLAGLRARLAQLDRGITNLVRQLGDDPDLAAAIRRTIVGMEQERSAVAAELARAETERQQATIIAAWTPADVQRLLTTLRDSLAADLAEDRVLAVRESLHALVGEIVLDLKSRAWEIHYRLDTGIKLASPRGRPVAPVTWISRGQVARRRVSAA